MVCFCRCHVHERCPFSKVFNYPCMIFCINLRTKLVISTSTFQNTEINRNNWTMICRYGLISPGPNYAPFCQPAGWWSLRYGIRRHMNLNNVEISCQWTTSWATWTHSLFSHKISLKFSLILLLLHSPPRPAPIYVSVTQTVSSQRHGTQFLSAPCALHSPLIISALI